MPASGTWTIVSAGVTDRDMKYASQTEALDRLIGVRSTLAGADKAEALESPEYLEAAWDVVVEHEPLIHFVLSKKKISPDMANYEDAASYLTGALFDCCWTYNPYIPNAAKFSTFAIQSISFQLLRFFDIEARKHMPYYIPINVTPEWVEDRTRAIYDELQQKLNSSDEIRYNPHHREKLREAAKKKMTPLLNAQWSMNARPINTKRFTVGEAGEYDQIELDPIELVPDSPEHTTPESDPVFEEVVADTTYQEVIKIMSEQLNLRDKTVLSLRFGLNGSEAHTLADIGTVLGLTPERIRQIERKAMGRLRGAIGTARYT